MQWNYFKNYLNKKIHSIMNSKLMKFCRMKEFRSNNRNNKWNKIIRKQWMKNKR